MNASMAGTARTWIKIVGGGLAALAVLVLGAALAAPLLVDRTALAERLAEAAAESLGAPVRIRAVTSLRLLPAPRLELAAVQIGGEAVPGEVRARIERLHAAAALIPALGGRLELTEVLIDGAEVRLPRRPAAAAAIGGSASPAAAFAGAAPDSAAVPGRFVVQTVAAEAGRSGAAPPDSAASLPPIGRLVIRDGAVRAAGGGRWRLDDLELEAGPLRAGRAGRLSAALSLDGPLPWLDTPALVEAPFTLSDDGARLRLSPLRIELPRLGLGPDAGDAVPSPAAVVDGRAEVDLRTGAARADGLRLSAGRLAARADAVLAGADAPSLSGSLSIPPFDLRAWLAEYGHASPPGRPEATLRRIGGRTDFVLAGGLLRLEHGELRVDSTAAALAARLALAEPPRGALALAFDGLALDPYLAPAPVTGDAVVPPEAADAPAADAAGSVLRPPLPALAGDTGPGLRLRLQANRVTAARLRYEAPEIEAEFADGTLQAQGRAGFYGGQVEADAGATPDPAGGPLRLHLDAHGSGAALAPLLTDALSGSERAAPVSGTVDFTLALTTRGAVPEAALQRLGGRARLDVRDGALTLVDIDRLLAGVLGRRSDGGPRLTRFSSLALTASGTEGRFHSDDIRMRSDLVHVDGSGDLDLGSQRLALDLVAVMVDAPEGRGIKELEGIEVPVSARGEWTSPTWQVDVEAVLDALSRRALDDDSGLLERIEERTGVPGLGDGLRQLLPGLLGR